MYAVVDEFSMQACDLFAKWGRNISVTHRDAGIFTDEPFSSLNVILCRDLHQFPPIPHKASAALYYPCDAVVGNTEDE
ncbi:hypothetical protein NEOLEDRAFT_1187922 [Neolentinus lepideus HHB14362 ss-1]|uniref:Uncharacterized protein n=1 Tax=Neolentinus lepideus HHB14362 ss-1 TaxID=1314782 RepID=A0A165WCU6_9AGAM|nr:hypothetical protein NEOLEDRAFT_1187922 [Neolentinus lepideus HHB14362 ss-1]